MYFCCADSSNSYPPIDTQLDIIQRIILEHRLLPPRISSLSSHLVLHHWSSDPQQLHTDNILFDQALASFSFTVVKKEPLPEIIQAIQAPTLTLNSSGTYEPSTESSSVLTLHGANHTTLYTHWLFFSGLSSATPPNSPKTLPTQCLLEINNLLLPLVFSLWSLVSTTILDRLSSRLLYKVCC